MTMDQASKDGRQALLTMASKPCMREVRRQLLPGDCVQSLLMCFGRALHATAAECFVAQLAALTAASTLQTCLNSGLMGMQLCLARPRGQSEAPVAWQLLQYVNMF